MRVQSWCVHTLTTLFEGYLAEKCHVTTRTAVQILQESMGTDIAQDKHHTCICNAGGALHFCQISQTHETQESDQSDLDCRQKI